MKDKIGILLIHGAGLGNYIWDDIKFQIEYSTLAIDFPNRELKGNPNKNLTFDNYIKSSIEQIEKWDKEKIVIVAHSIGGCLGLKLNDYFNEKVVGFVGISSAIPKNGKSFSSCLPFPQSLLIPIILSVFGTKPPKKSIEIELCNDLSTSKSAKIVDRFTPEAKSLYTTKINYASLPERKLYIKLTNDKGFPIGVQEEMIKNLNPQNVIEMDCGHLPMISKPKELAEIINSFARNEL